MRQLLAAFGTDRDRFHSATEVQQYTGIAPVTERSGKRTRVYWRWAASTFLRQSFHEFAGLSIQHSAWARAFYELQRERGRATRRRSAAQASRRATKRERNRTHRTRLDRADEAGRRSSQLDSNSSRN